MRCFCVIVSLFYNLEKKLVRGDFGEKNLTSWYKIHFAFTSLVIRL